MKIFTTCVFILTLASNAIAGKPGGNSCTNVPISMTFVATNAAPAAIWNDDATKVYANGVEGVDALIIFNSDCNGSRDAVMGFTSKSKRFISYKIPGAIPGSIIASGPPSYAGGAAIQVKALVNVRNILGKGVLTPGVASTFYTKVGSTFTGPDGKSYRLRFYPDDSACPGDLPCVPNLHEVGEPANLNQPEQSAWVRVTYNPRNPAQPYSSANADSWIVEGELIKTSGTVERMTLLSLPGGNSPWTHYGQYSMPFKILVTALAPLP